MSKPALPRINSLLPYLELLCAALAAGLWYTQGGAVWYAGAWPGPWPLLLLVIPWLARWLLTSASFRLTVFDLPVWLFLASGLIGVWVAYDPGPAWAKFWLIVGAIGLYYALAHQPDLKHLYVALALLGLFGVVVTSYFFATTDWEEYGVKVAALVALGKQISSLFPSLAAHRIHPNVIGGMLAAVMPIYVAGIRWKVEGGKWKAAMGPGWLVGWAIAGLGWLTSASRGAWLAALGVGGAWAVWRGLGWLFGRRQRDAERAWKIRLIAMGGLLVAALPLALIAARQVLSSPLPIAGALDNRLDLLNSSWLLARDYLFTGAGLGMFQMQFSIYTLLIHVGFITHSHNMFMDILIDQGLVGLIAVIWLAAACIVLGVRQLRQASDNTAWIIEAGLASMLIVLAHGLVDDALYGSRGLLIMLAPFGLVMAASRQHSTFTVHRIALAGLGILAILAAVAWQPLLGIWYANWGAVEQARVELSHYDQAHFDNPTMDQVRQQNNLDQAIALLERAAKIDPANITARQRLAAIALSRGQYADALGHMQAAWEAGHHDSVTRLLLGDAYAANGQPEQAAEVVRGLRWAEARLDGQAWARYWINKDYQRAADAWAAIVLLNPNNQGAAAAQAQAAQRAKQNQP